MPKVDLKTVLASEFEALHGRPSEPITDEPSYRRAVSGLPRRRAALCLSGGGIRSASFALGVLQSLARHGLLQQFHYLSTVSGGGYIGSWVQAWRLQAGGLAPVLQQLNARDPETSAEPPELQGLRENSAYLTPKLGITSADTWTLLVLYLRNLILNWAVLAPLFLAVLALPWLGYDLTALVAGFPACATFPLLATFGSLALAVGLHGAAWQRRVAPPPGRGQPSFLLGVLLPVQTAAAILALAAATGTKVPGLFAALWGSGIYLVAFVSAWLRARKGLSGLLVLPSAKNPVPLWLEAALWVLCGALAGFCIVLGFRIAGDNLRRIVVLGVGCFMLAILVPEIVFVGLASYSNSGDHDREWLARSAGWLLAGAVVWMGVAALVLYAGAVAASPGTLIALGASLVAGGATAAAGHSAQTAATLALSRARDLLPSGWFATLRSQLGLERLLEVGGLIFVAALAVVLAALDTRVLVKLSPRPLDFRGWPAWPGSNAAWDAAWIAMLLGFGLLVSFLVNVNRFSLHGVYRNRLIRAFLGSARLRSYEPQRPGEPPRPPRCPNRFTGFDQDDNPALHRLWPADQPDAERFLFPVLNMALNLVGGDNPAWQERKAESFTATPLHCGSSRVGFRPTAEYGGMSAGMSLGTATAISGAAASPNMGYHSSPLVGFVMTLFNVRLGWWLGNPRGSSRTARGDGPYFGAGATIRELFGLTTDTARYVYLSDGGHFENLGIYEMVRRRCRFILVSDAGADPKGYFEDLGNAVRKIRIDFGLRIEFEKLVIDARASPAQPGIDSAIASIRYPDDDAAPGVLIYVKPGYHGTESPDIRSYANLHPEFPHESTINQFFTESQMESYRALGADTLDLMCRPGRPNKLGAEHEQLDLAQFEQRVRQYLGRVGAGRAEQLGLHLT